MFSYLCLLFTAYPIGAHAFSFTLQLMLWLVYGSALARQQAQAASLAYFSRIRTLYAVMCRTCTARYGFGGTGSGITCAPNARPLTGVLVCASFQAGLKMKKSRASRWGPVHPLHITTEHVRDSFRADTVTDLAGVAAIPTYYSEAARILIRSALHAL